MKNKKIIFVCGERKRESVMAISAIMDPSLRVSKTKGLPRFWQAFSLFFSDVVIVEDNIENSPKKVRSFIKKQRSPMLVLTGTGGRLRKENILLKFSRNGSIVMDYSLSRKIRKRKVKKMLTFGNRKSADIHVTDINRGEDTNFKVSHKGGFTPFWTKGKLKNREIYAVICALAVGVFLSFNLVEMSSRVKQSRIFTEN